MTCDENGMLSIAAAVAKALTDGRTPAEISMLHNILNLIDHNLIAILHCRNFEEAEQKKREEKLRP